MTVNELNTKVIIKDFASVKDADTGKISSTLTASWSKWAKVEQTNGNRVLDNASINYKETYTITMRYEISRKTLSNYKAEYKGRDLTIHSVIKKYEGLIWWEQATAFTTL